MPKREKRKYDKKLLANLVHSGRTNNEISEIMDASISQVQWWVKECDLTGIRGKAPKRIAFRDNRKDGLPDGKKLNNADHHLCKTCEYRAVYSLRANGARCDYIGHTGKMRGCPAEECNVYKPKKINRKKSWVAGQ